MFSFQGWDAHFRILAVFQVWVIPSALLENFITSTFHILSFLPPDFWTAWNLLDHFYYLKAKGIKDLNINVQKKPCSSILYVILALQEHKEWKELRDGSSVKSTSCSCRKPRFDFQHPHQAAYHTVTIASEDPTSSSGLPGHSCALTQACTHK